MIETLIPRHGGYGKLKSFIVAQRVFDGAAGFCERYIDTRSRTCDHMQAFEKEGGFTERLYRVRSERRRSGTRKS